MLLSLNPIRRKIKLNSIVTRSYTFPWLWLIWFPFFDTQLKRAQQVYNSGHNEMQEKSRGKCSNVIQNQSKGEF